MEKYFKEFEKNTKREEITHRGGGVEVSLSFLGPKYEGQNMTAYQNYLGGGIRGRIGNDCTVKHWEQDSKLAAVAEQLRKYYHKRSDGDEYNDNYDDIQKRSLSAY